MSDMTGQARCRGDFSLGTACGTCWKCKERIAELLLVESKSKPEGEVQRVDTMCIHWDSDFHDWIADQAGVISVSMDDEGICIKFSEHAYLKEALITYQNYDFDMFSVSSEGLWIMVTAVRPVKNDLERDINIFLFEHYTILGIDRPANHDNIVEFMVDDVSDTADAKYSIGDFSIAFRRFLERDYDQ